jgi:hypothetical protein
MSSCLLSKRLTPQMPVLFVKGRAPSLNQTQL